MTTSIYPSDNKIKVILLFSYDEKLKCEMFLIEFLPGCEHISPPHQADVIERVLVAEGSMEVFHKKAELWLPPDLHVEANETKDTDFFHNLTAEEKECMISIFQKLIPKNAEIAE